MLPLFAVVDRWRFLGSLAAGVLLVLPFLGLGLGRGDDAGRHDGLILTVPNPIKGDTAEAVRNKILDAAIRQKRTLKTIVFDFNPDDLPASTISFGGCLELADLIRKLQLGDTALPRVQTVAYVHKAVTGHTVLPVLACEQIVFGPDGSLGDVPQDGVTQATHRTAYREQTKYHTSPDVAMRVVDPELVLRRVKTGQASRLISNATLEDWRRQGKDVSVVPGEPPRGLEPGKALIDAETARDNGLALAILGSRGELVESFGLSRRALNEDWLIDRTPVPWRIELRGPLDSGKLQSLDRRIKHAIGRNANLIILQLDSRAGDPRHAAAFAKEIAELRDATGTRPVRTVAYVPPNVNLGAATFLALGCNEIVMGRNSSLADFGYLAEGDRAPVAEMLTTTARMNGYPPLVFLACLEPMTLVRVKAAGDATGLPRFIRAEQFKRDQETGSPKWVPLGEMIVSERGKFRIMPALARECQIASATDVDSVDALNRTLGLDADKVRISRDDALDQVAEFFREPWVNFLLIMVGIIGLILEVKLPGTTVPGTIAAICFVLFFWAYSFVGEFTLLAVLLFLLGLVMLAVEVFVIPGVTFVGLAGLALVIVSLGLVTLDHFPTTPAEWLGLGSTLTTFGLSLVAAAVGAVCLTYYLPSIPYASRLVLKPPPEQPVAAPAARTPLGAIGVSVTTLRPAGKVQFGDDFVDVVAEGSYVEPGTRVQIIEIEGNRVVVKEI